MSKGVGCYSALAHSQVPAVRKWQSSVTASLVRDSRKAIFIGISTGFLQSGP